MNLLQKADLNKSFLKVYMKSRFKREKWKIINQKHYQKPYVKWIKNIKFDDTKIEKYKFCTIFQ